jgi:hypothetical protein
VISLRNSLLSLVLSLLFFLMWPIGILIRHLRDPLQLSPSYGESYLRMAPVNKAQLPVQPPDLLDCSRSEANKQF